MRKTSLILIVAIVAVISYFFIRKSSPDLASPNLPKTGVVNQPENNPPSSTNPYLIQSMKSRSYSSQIIIENQVRQTSNFTSYKVSYSSDNLKLFALMNVPRGNPPSGGWPVVIVNHGYIDPNVYSTENSYINTSAYYANAGFLVLKPDYRGHDNSEGEADGLLSRINYAVDVLNLIAAIKDLENANENSIYLYGHSMGGDVSLRVLEVCEACVKGASLWAPAVTNWPESFLYFTRRDPNPTQTARHERRMRELSENFTTQEYDLVSTFDNVNLVKVPVIIQHGTNDQSVPYEWGTSLSQQFEKHNITHQFYSYPGDNHDIAANWGRALARDVEFFNSIN